MESKPDKTQEFMSLFQTKQPRTITKVIDRYGNFIGSFSAENRIWIAERDIPPIFKEGLIATEDGNFWNHDGVSFTGLVRAAKNFLISFGENRQQGGSTITMQLVRVVSNKREKKINRKIEEIKLALELEKRFSKEKILEMYCNEVYFGGSRYGIEAASQFYFSKSITELKEEECALLIALIQSPEKYYKMLISGSDSELLTVRNRRDYVLTKMYQANLIKSSDELEILKSKPMRVFELSSSSIKAGSYPLEEVRKDLYERYGREKAIEGGLTVYTTIDLTWQKIAEDSLKEGLMNVDKTLGFRKPIESSLRSFPSKSSNSKDTYLGDKVSAVILSWTNNGLLVSILGQEILMSSDDLVWPLEILRKKLNKGDRILVNIVRIDRGIIGRVKLHQQPDIQGSIIAIEQSTGEIRAMVGGYDYDLSKFNRATQSRRQVGSTFKPFIYGAAFESGYNPLSLVSDIPTGFLDDNLYEIKTDSQGDMISYRPRYQSSKPYVPSNYHSDFIGDIPIYRAMALSQNIPAVRTMAQIGPSKVIDFAHKCGIDSQILSVPSTALGVQELTLQEMVRAYGTIANNGVKTPKPSLITKIVDVNGVILYQQPTIDQEEVIDPRIAFQLVQTLQSVVEMGTAKSSKSMGIQLAGKTGTTDSYTDGWFIGFSPNITIGVWVGFDKKRTIYSGADGASIALPIWTKLIRHYSKVVMQNKFVEPVGLSRVKHGGYEFSIISESTKVKELTNKKISKGKVDLLPFITKD